MSVMNSRRLMGNPAGLIESCLRPDDDKTQGRVRGLITLPIIMTANAPSAGRDAAKRGDGLSVSGRSRPGGLPHLGRTPVYIPVDRYRTQVPSHLYREDGRFVCRQTFSNVSTQFGLGRPLALEVPMRARPPSFRCTCSTRYTVTRRSSAAEAPPSVPADREPRPTLFRC